MSPAVLVDAHAEHSGVFTLTLNRAKTRNALKVEVLQELLKQLKRVEEDPKARAVVLTGSGDTAFSVWGDCEPITENIQSESYESYELYARTLKAIATMSVPIVAAINGMALGGGFGLAMMCDFAVAADDVEFGAYELSKGVFPLLTAEVLSTRMPVKILSEIVYLGYRLPARRAVELGFVNKVVSSSEVLPEAYRICGRLTSLPSGAMRLGREHATSVKTRNFISRIDDLTRGLRDALVHEDAKEGALATLERRPPRWSL